jgi:hypothetical protein
LPTPPVKTGFYDWRELRSPWAYAQRQTTQDTAQD